LVKVDLRSDVPEEVEITVEPVTVDAIGHVIGIGIGVGCAHLQIAESAGGGCGLRQSYRAAGHRE
jgi:hypothetical protein